MLHDAPNFTRRRLYVPSFSVNTGLVDKETSTPIIGSQYDSVNKRRVRNALVTGPSSSLAYFRLYNRLSDAIQEKVRIRKTHRRNSEGSIHFRMLTTQ